MEADNKNKALKVLFVVLTFVMLLLPLISMPLGLNASGAEKRTLSEMPKLVDDGKINTDFTGQFDTFFSENFGLRSNMITAYSALAYHLTGDSVNDKVIAGKDGWLFYYETIDDYVGKNTLSDSDIRSLYKILQMQKEFLEEKGISFIFIVAPNKNSIYPEFMPERYVKSESESSLEKLNKYLSQKDVAYVDLQEHLTLGRSAEQLYHKKDTHWNNYGAMLACSAIFDKVGELIPEYAFNEYTGVAYTAEKSWNGDLDTMLFPALNKKDVQFRFDIEMKYKYKKPLRTFEDIKIETELTHMSETENKRLLMFRDSFANAMIPFLSNEFDYAMYSRSVPYDYNLINEADPDVVILEIAERNLKNLLLSSPLIPDMDSEITR
ncbi:MAG: hypothetical protein PHV32_08305 [Eubacteriales bacterium]|nr:hypothetical protein [Eubacteriales bacterium]